MVFRTKSMVKALAKQYNLYIKDDIMINLELKANLTNQEQAVSRKKKIIDRLRINGKNIIVRGVGAKTNDKFGNVEALLRTNSDFALKDVKRRLKSEGLLLNQRYWDLSVPTIYLHKFIKMLNNFEAFCKKQENEYTEIKADIKVRIKLENEDWYQ